MKENKAKTISAELLKVGETAVWLNPDERERLKEAMTKEDVRMLIKDGIIKKKKKNLQSKAGARILAEKKAKGRKKGRGKRTGTKKSRTPKKENWIKNVRAQRKALNELKESGVPLKKPARKIYEMIKGGYFKGKKYVKAMVEGESK